MLKIIVNGLSLSFFIIISCLFENKSDKLLSQHKIYNHIVIKISLK